MLMQKKKSDIKLILLYGEKPVCCYARDQHMVNHVIYMLRQKPMKHQVLLQTIDNNN